MTDPITSLALIILLQLQSPTFYLSDTIADLATDQLIENSLSSILDESAPEETALTLSEKPIVENLTTLWVLCTTSSLREAKLCSSL